MNKNPDKPPMDFSNGALKRLVILATVFLLIEIPLLLSHARHGYFKIDGWFAFYVALGLAASGLLVFLSRAAGGMLRREEDHYGDQADETVPEDLDEQLR